jgi:predicted amidohydrolase YtcJ
MLGPDSRVKDQAGPRDMEAAVTTSQAVIYEGPILTMTDSEEPCQEGILVHDGKILAVGIGDVSDAVSDVLAPAGVSPKVIELPAGYVMMPGFVEGHTHALRWGVDYTSPDLTDRLNDLDAAMAVALKMGWTTLNELSGDQDFVDLLLAAETQDRLRLRVNVYPWYNKSTLDQGKTQIAETWFPKQGPMLNATSDPNNLLQIPGIKIFADGAGVPGRGDPALTIEYPAAATAAGYGDLYLSEEKLKDVVAKAQAMGHRVAIHAMGDRAIDAAISAIDAATGGSNLGYRHQVHHNSFLRDDQIEAHLALGILTSIRGYWNTCQTNMFDKYGKLARQWMNRYKLAFAAGDLAFCEGDFGSWQQDPFDPSKGRPLNPFLSLWSLVTKMKVGSADPLVGLVPGPRKPTGEASSISTYYADRPMYAPTFATGLCVPQDVLPGSPWLSEYLVELGDPDSDYAARWKALRMLSYNAAYAGSQESVVGTLEAGKFADLIVVDANPLDITDTPAADLWELYVVMTMVRGKTEYVHPSLPGLCADCSP